MVIEMLLLCGDYCILREKRVGYVVVCFVCLLSFIKSKVLLNYILLLLKIYFLFKDVK